MGRPSLSLAVAAPEAPAADLLGGLALAPAMADDDVPLLRVAAPALPPSHGAWMAWRSDDPVHAGSHGRIRYRASADWLFGCLHLDESVAPGAADEGQALARLAESAYREIFALLDTAGYETLARAWNYVPRINATAGDLERYRHFNLGRQRAFATAGRVVEVAVPAACALGVDEGPLAIAFLASWHPTLPVENPRQVAAWRYPPDYGPASPTFARATLVEGVPPLLFVSGTASIVGHVSLHPGDVVAQTTETLDNLDAVLAEAGRLGGAVFDPRALALTVYVRHAHDVDAVRATLEARWGRDLAVHYLRADICRADLLVEIEASGGHPIKTRRP